MNTQNTHKLYAISKRRRQAYMRKISIVLSVLIFAVGAGILFGDDSVSAQDNHAGICVTKSNTEDASLQKRYKSIQIVYGDTLWDIAGKYRTDGYSSTKEYLQEIKEINGLLEDDIHEGQYLTIPYYEIL